MVLGRCKELTKVEKFGEHHLDSNMEWDSMHAAAGKVVKGVYKGFLRNEEWIVRFPQQVEISRLVCSILS